MFLYDVTKSQKGGFAETKKLVRQNKTRTFFSFPFSNPSSFPSFFILNQMPSSSSSGKISSPRVTTPGNLEEEVFCPGVRLAPIRPAPKSYRVSSSDEDPDGFGGLGRNVQTLKRDIIHLKRLFPRKLSLCCRVSSKLVTVILTLSFPFFFLYYYFFYR